MRVLGFEFVNFDDGPYVYGNRHVSGPISIRSITWAFTAVHSFNWHPITWISHMIDCRIFGIASPGGHHATSVLLHIANALLLFGLLRGLTGSNWRSGFVAGLFALHPTRVESVAWIAERKDVLSTFFMLLTLLAYASYAKHRGPWRYLVSLFLFALGLMSKPMLVSLPILLLLLDLWPLQRLSSSKNTTIGSLLLEKLPFFALAGASCVVTYIVQINSGAAQMLGSLPLGVRVANALVAYFSYIGKMLWPARLTPLYPHPENTLPAWQVIAAGAGMVVATVLAVRYRRSRPYIFTGWLWYVVSLVPVIGLVQVGQQAMADRYSYVPFIGLFVIVAWGAVDSLARFGRCGRTLPITAGVIVALLLGTCTWFQTGCWSNTSTLTAHAMAATDGANTAVMFLADSLQKQGELDQAAAVLKRAALQDRPGIGRAHAMLGDVLLNAGRNAEAEEHIRKAIELEPRLVAPRNSLGVLLVMKGRPEGALQAFRGAASIDPRSSDAHFGIGLILESQGKTDEALSEYKRAIRFNAERNDARSKLAIIYRNRGQLREAITVLRDAIDVNPEQSDALCMLGSIYLENGDVDKAIPYLQRAADAEFGSGLPHSYLAEAYFMKEEYAAAWQEVMLAREYGVKPDPDFIQALSQMMPQPRD